MAVHRGGRRQRGREGLSLRLQSPRPLQDIQTQRGRQSPVSGRVALQVTNVGGKGMENLSILQGGQLNSTQEIEILCMQFDRALSFLL